MSVRRILVIVFCACLFSPSALKALGDASSDTISNRPRGVWKTTSKPSLQLDSKFFDNWSSAGFTQTALTATFNGNYKFSHPIFIWDNVVDMALGVVWLDLDNDRKKEELRKSLDKIDVTSTYSMRVRNYWNINASANFKSQFSNGYDYSNGDTIFVSSFMAPGYLTTAIGFEYKRDCWNASYSFLTGKITFVENQMLIDNALDTTGGREAKAQLYGVEVAEGKHSYSALGSYLRFYFKKDIFKGFNLYARLELFYDYRKPNLIDWSTPENQKYDTYVERLGRCLIHETDVDAETKLEYRFSRFFAAYLGVCVKYDTDYGKSGSYGMWQLYQSAGLQIYFDWKTPKN